MHLISFWHGSLCTLNREEKVVRGLANAIAWVIQSANEGTGFAFKSFVSGKMMDMAVSALFPILLIVPLFDILMYFNVLPKIIGAWVGY